jgi:ABC-type polysaccharide/polyol phosphate export permease
MATQVSSTTTPIPQVFPPEADTLPGLNWVAVIRRDARELYRYRAVLTNLVAQDLRVRYQRSLLGFLWTLLNPILMMAVMSVVFSQLFKFEKGGADYALYLFSGMVPWSLLSTTVVEGSTCIITNEYLIRKIYIPKLVFPLSRLLLNATMLVLSMAALFLLMVPLGARLTPSLLLVPVGILLFSGFVMGLSLIAATVNTFYRDFGHLLSVLISAWYFATPVIYPIEALPEEVAWRFWLNPAYAFIEFFHVVIYEGAWPSWVLVSSSAGISAVVLGIGYVTFKSYEDRLVFRL